MGLRAFVLEQFGRPNGRATALTARYLNLTNRGINRATLAFLNVGPNDRVLDVGFGGGVGLRRLLETAPDARLAGVDVSPDVVALGRRTFAPECAAGRIELRVGSVEALPWADGSFDRAYAVNSIYFWPDRQRALREIRRVLRPAGQFVLAVYDKARVERLWPGTSDQLLSEREASAALSAAGFAGVHARRRGHLLTRAVLVKGVQPAPSTRQVHHEKGAQQ